MTTKKWYQSKTLWTNGIAIAAMLIVSFTGVDIDGETQAAIATGVLAVINVVLRLVTNKSVTP